MDEEEGKEEFENMKHTLIHFISHQKARPHLGLSEALNSTCSTAKKPVSPLRQRTELASVYITGTRGPQQCVSFR